VKETGAKKFTTKKNVKKVSNSEPRSLSVESRIAMPDVATDRRKKNKEKDKEKEEKNRSKSGTSDSNSNSNSSTEGDVKNDSGEEEQIKFKVEGGGKRESDRNTKSGTRKPKVYTAPKSTTNSRARRSDQRKINSDNNKLVRDKELVLDSPPEQASAVTSSKASARVGE
jgi:hypothetical protein